MVSHKAVRNIILCMGIDMVFQKYRGGFSKVLRWVYKGIEMGFQRYRDRFSKV